MEQGGTDNALDGSAHDSDSGAEASEEGEGPLMEGPSGDDAQGPCGDIPEGPAQGAASRRAPPCAVCSEPASRWWSTCPQCGSRAHVECLARRFAGVGCVSSVDAYLWAASMIDAIVDGHTMCIQRKKQTVPASRHMAKTGGPKWHAPGGHLSLLRGPAAMDGGP